MKPGTKLKSAVCDTEVMVIKAPAEGAISCGGAPMAVDKPADKPQLIRLLPMARSWANVMSTKPVPQSCYASRQAQAR